MKFFKYFFISSLLLFPSLLFAANQCASTGYTVATINGVFTDEQGAKGNMAALRKVFGISWNNQNVDYQYLLNPSHLGGIGDLAISVYQKLFESETVADYDLVEMLKDASAKVQTQKLLLFAHSQGNFYANSFYDTVADKEGGVPAKSIGIYSVANPASRVAGNGKWMTSDTDHVIAGLVQHLAFFRKIMPTNEHIAEVAGGLDPSSGHDLTTVYLKYRSTEIVKGIQESLDKLSHDPSRSESAQCIDPPKLSLAHKIEGAVLVVADPVATVGVTTVVTTAKVGVFVAVTTVKAGVVATVWTYHTTVAVATWTYHTAVAVAVWTFDTGVTIAKVVGSTAVAVASTVYDVVAGALTSKSIASNNMASVILATQPVQKSSSVLVNNNQTTVVAVPVAQSQTPPVITAQKPQTVFVFEPKVQAGTNVPKLVFVGSFVGGGSTASPSTHITEEVKDDMVTTTTEAVLEATSTDFTADTVADSPDGVTPLSPSNTIIATTTVTFSGSYANNATFDTIVFELKNISTSTATSSVSRAIATTTGSDLAYSEGIKLSEEGNWQYRAKLADSVNATSTPWSSLAFFNLTISTTTATSTPVILGYTVVAEQSERSTLDTTSSYVQGYGLQHNVILKQPVTFSGINKGDLGRVVVWYKFGYGQDCSAIKMVSMNAGPGTSGASFTPVSPAPNWDGSCVFRLSAGDESVTLEARAYVLYVYSETTHAPPYVYGKAGEPSSAVYCKGIYIYADSCRDVGGYSTNLSDFAYIITSDTYIPPPLPDGASSVPATMSPIIAEQTDHSSSDATILDANSGYSTIQWNVVLPHPITFTGVNKGDKGRVVVWYSFAPGQDCSTVLWNVSLSSGFNNPAVSLLPILKTPTPDGACIFHLATVDGQITLPAGAYALGIGGYQAGGPIPLGKSGGNSNAVYCAGNVIGANSCEKLRGYSANLSDFAYLVTEDTYATPQPTSTTQSSARSISAFNVMGATSTISGVIDDIAHTVILTVPFGADVHALVPVVAVSPFSTSSPASNVPQDFTNPATYIVTAEDGSSQSYVVTVIVAPAPDTTPPTITNYTFNSRAGDIVADFATTTPTVNLLLTASENVNWVSIKIEDKNNSNNYKIFYSDSTGCKDNTTECAKSWTGALSSGGAASDGIYQVKVNIKDSANNTYNDYLLTYFITVRL